MGSGWVQPSQEEQHLLMATQEAKAQSISATLISPVLSKTLNLDCLLLSPLANKQQKINTNKNPVMVSNMIRPGVLQLSKADQHSPPSILMLSDIKWTEAAMRYHGDQAARGLERLEP